MIPWKFLKDGRCLPGDTMSRDLDLFEAVRAGSIAGAFRVYYWSEPAVTIGFHQKNFLFHDRSLALPVLKRPTGGGAVLHVHDLTFSMSLNPEGLFPSGIPECSERISGIFALAFRSCGVEVRMQGGGHTFAEVCFSRSSPAELVATGSKMLGLALLRKGKYLLVQGTIPLRIDARLSQRVFGDRLKGDLKGIFDLVPGFSVETLIESLRSAFLSEVGVLLPDGDEEDYQGHDADGGKVETR
jgi:lipoate-protein ligase A